ncbi:SRPBCC family protein [Micromonospora sp. CPCC 206060]|uniref:type II toxin-antitoxin system RatA family toxin n=1 Tax=Micromonospora sp. CPCC 206060 TaxID=3122406 RepID=UPI002FEFB507
MPRVHAAHDIRGAAIDDVWNVVSAFERYPAVMPNVLSVDILERSGREAVSAWRVLLDGTEMTWEERDVFDAPHRITFNQVDGDLAVFRGDWQLTDLGDRVRVELTLEFDLGIPSLSAVLDPLGAQAIEANSRGMLAAIGEQLTALEKVA